MNKKNITILLSAIVVVLLGAVGFVVYSLRGNSDTQQIVAKKTRAAPITYNRTIPLNTPTPADTISVTPVATNSAANITPSPTEIILAVASTSATVAPTLPVSSAPLVQLPQTGAIQGTILLACIAGAFIAFAFLF